MTREKRLRLIAENMDMFSDLPADYEEFTNKSVFKLDNIIIYSTKEKKAYCTGCKSRITNLKLFEKKPTHSRVLRSYGTGSKSTRNAYTGFSHSCRRGIHMP